MRSSCGVLTILFKAGPSSKHYRKGGGEGAGASPMERANESALPSTKRRDHSSRS